MDRSPQYSRDLETGLVSDNYHSSNRQEHSEMLINHPHDETGDLSIETRTLFDQSLPYNLMAIIVPLLKIFATIFVLAVERYTCFGPKQWWLFGMLLHDFLHARITQLKLSIILSTRRMEAITENQNSGANTNNNNNDQSPANNQGGYQMDQIQLANLNNMEVAPQQGANIENGNSSQNSNAQRETPQSRMLADILRRKDDVIKLTQVCTYYWMFLFIFWLEVDSLNKPVKGACGDTERINGLVGFYIFMAWMYLLQPMIICMMGCLCLPVIVVAFMIFGRPTQVPSSNTEILNLPITKYTSELPGNKECAICMCDYQDQENVIQLECSKLHHFHEECIKSWLKVNGQCPICRTRVGARRDQPVAEGIHLMLH